MISIFTDRLELCSSCTVNDGVFSYPETNGEISIFNPPKTTYGADCGFAVYLKSGEPIGHIDVLFKKNRPPYELSIFMKSITPSATLPVSLVCPQNL